MAKKIAEVENRSYLGPTRINAIPIPDDAKIVSIKAECSDIEKKAKRPIGFMSADLSIDGGQTWISNWMGCSIDGGVIISERTRAPATHRWVCRKLPEAKNRLIRINVNADISFRTSLVVEDDEPVPGVLNGLGI